MCLSGPKVFALMGSVSEHAAFADQVLPVDPAAAEHYAVIVTSRERAGKPIAGFDALIAAVCRSKGAALAIRNVSDFDGTGVETIDPWLP